MVLSEDVFFDDFLGILTAIRESLASHHERLSTIETVRLSFYQIEKEEYNKTFKELQKKQNKDDHDEPPSSGGGAASSLAY